jgi:hypothetical protein
MAKGTINVNQNNNRVILQDQNPKITVTDNVQNKTVNVTPVTTKIVTVQTLGPQGPQWNGIRSGSAEISGSLFVDGNLTASGDISSSGDASFLDISARNITASGHISASVGIYADQFEFGPGTPTANNNLLGEGRLYLRHADGAGNLELYQNTSNAGFWKNYGDAYILVDHSTMGASTASFIVGASILPGVFATKYLEIKDGGTGGNVSSIRHITASGTISTSANMIAQSFTGSINTNTIDVTSITASNISASGYVSASQFIGSFSGSIDNANTASYVLASNIDQPFVNITASGNISASGTVLAKDILIPSNGALYF